MNNKTLISRLLLVSLVLGLCLLFNYLSYWLIPERLAKHVYLNAFKNPPLFTTKMHKYLAHPNTCISLAKDLIIEPSFKEQLFILPAIIQYDDVRYVHHQNLSNDIIVYYVSAMPIYDSKVKVDARILIRKINYKWIVESITVDSISTPVSKPSFITY